LGRLQWNGYRLRHTRIIAKSVVRQAGERHIAAVNDKHTGKDSGHLGVHRRADKHNGLRRDIDPGHGPDAFLQLRGVHLDWIAVRPHRLVRICGQARHGTAIE
jgi:hypothetical protein